MSSITFDTLKFVKTLKASGMSEDQAEAIANAVRDAQETQLATKADVQDLKHEIMSAKFEMIKWTLALLLAQTGLIIAAVKFLT